MHYLDPHKAVDLQHMMDILVACRNWFQHGICCDRKGLITGLLTIMVGT